MGEYGGNLLDGTGKIRMKPKNYGLVGGLEHFSCFPYIGNVILPTDFHIFQRGWSTTNQNGGWSGKHPGDQQVGYLRLWSSPISSDLEVQKPGFTHGHRIGWWDNLQESPIFDGKNHGFRLRFSLKPIQWPWAWTWPTAPSWTGLGSPFLGHFSLKEIVAPGVPTVNRGCYSIASLLGMFSRFFNSTLEWFNFSWDELVHQSSLPMAASRSRERRWPHQLQMSWRSCSKVRDHSRWSLFQVGSFVSVPNHQLTPKMWWLWYMLDTSNMGKLKKTRTTVLFRNKHEVLFSFFRVAVGDWSFGTWIFYDILSGRPLVGIWNLYSAVLCTCANKL